MIEPLSYQISPQTLHRWRALAEQRHAHFLELYMSGRWRYYYDEQDFIVRMREAIQLLDMWKSLSTPTENLAAPAQDLASEDLASEDLASRDLASQDLASQDLASQDLASHDLAPPEDLVPPEDLASPEDRLAGSA